MCTPIRPISLNTNGGRNSLRRLVGISLHHLSWKLEFGPLLMMQSTTEEAELTSVSALRPSLFKVSPPKRTGATHESCHLLGQTRTTRLNARLRLLSLLLFSAEWRVIALSRRLLTKAFIFSSINPFIFAIKAKLTPSVIWLFSHKVVSR